MSGFKQVLFVLIFIFNIPAKAQHEFYSQGHIAEVRLYFSQAGWRHRLDSLFLATQGTERMLADISIDGHYLKNVGVRYKGFSSWNEGEIKNPFNIELDYTLKNQNHRGFTKIKLSNVIHDPSFVREVLAYEIVRKYMPASGAGFANLYINDTLIGLYTNVEAVDKSFIAKYFPDNDNSFIKGDPTNLQYPFGQNANLAHTHGDDSSGYLPYYKLESDYGWSDLYHFITCLNEVPDSVEKWLNIDQALWMHALNYSLLNLDSYIGYAQNYYIYEDNNGRFNPIMWDLNMSFGSFRTSDGSTHFQGLTIPEIKALDPLQHLDFSISPRPLMKNLFKNDTLKRMYLAHMRTVMNENIRNNWFFDRGKELQDIIRSDVQKDTNKFYSNDDFESNLMVTVGGSGGMLQYPGLLDLMTSRLEYLDTYQGFTGAPVISDIHSYPENAEKGKECWITSYISDASNVLLYYRNNKYDIFQYVIMYDDGAHQDSDAGDHIYGAGLIPESCDLQYYIYAENDSAGVFSPARAAYEYYHLYIQPEKGDLVINELSLGNPGEKWMEVLNNKNEDMLLSGTYLKGDINLPFQWMFPDTLIPAHSFLVIYFSGGSDTSLQCSLQVSSQGGGIYMFNTTGKVVDKIQYTSQIQGKSYGRYPNGYGDFIFMDPTPDRNNLQGSTPSDGFLCYPNPAGSVLYLEFTKQTGIGVVDVFNILGQKLQEDQWISTEDEPCSALIRLDITSLSSGQYIVRLRNHNNVSAKHFFKY